MCLTEGAGPVKPDDGDWFAVRAGWIVHLLFGLCATSVVLFLAASAKRAGNGLDWGALSAPLSVLLAGLSSCAIYTGWMAYGREIRWNGDQISVRRLFGRNAILPLSRVREIHRNVFPGEYVVHFEDGQKLRIPVLMKGAHQLVSHLQNRDAEAAG